MPMKSNSALLWVIAIVIVVLGVVYFSKPAPEAPVQPVVEEKTAAVVIPDGPIVLGAMAPLTGDAAVYGIAFKTATDLAVEEVNAAGGVNGHQLQLMWEDEKCTPEAGATIATKFVEVDKLKYLIGTVCSGSTLAAAEITEPAGVLLLSAGASSPDLSTAGDFVFRTYPSDGIGGQIQATYMFKELGKKKLAAISEQSDYAQALRKTFTSTFVKLGGEVVTDETYNSGDTDFRTQILKIKAGAPDVVYVNPQTPVSGTLILKQLKESGVEAQVIVNDSMLSADNIKQNSALFEGVYSSSPDLDPSREQTKKYLDNYQAKYQKAPDYPAYLASAYDQIFMLKDAFEEVGIEPSAVRDWLYQVKDWPGALGNITIDQNGDPVIGFHIKFITNAEIQDKGAYSL